MKLVIALMGILILAATPGQAREMRDTRIPMKSRYKAAERYVYAIFRVRGDAPREGAATTTSRLAIAIDSETGEPCFVSARLADLFNKQKRLRQPRRI